ncbi:MAG TPA: hypothetical protein VK988_18825 [Acidimicrobiales bacterium]|nr:hypothetical protein [Acidimicrobiales bacterium]
MGSLADLVGPVERIEPPIKVNVGEVMVTLRHNSPRKVVRPGRNLRRGKGLPLTLDPHGIRVSTEDIPIDVVEVPNIALVGPFGLPLISLRVVIRVDEDDDYLGLRDYIATKGVNFAELLDGELANAMDMHVRTVLGGHSHDELWEMGNLTPLLHTHSTLLDGLFRLESVTHESVVWHPEFEQVKAAIAASRREEAEKLLRLGQVDLDRKVSAAEDQLALEAAVRRGVTLWELEHPEHLAASGQQEHEVRLELIKQMDAIRRGAGAEGVRAVLGIVGSSGAASGQQQSDEGQRALSLGQSPQESTYRYADPVYEGSSPGVHEPAGSYVCTAGYANPENGLGELRSDRILAQMWLAAGLPGNPFGLGHAGEGPNSTVIAVVDTVLSPDEITAIRRAFSRSLGADIVVTIGQPRSIADIVTHYLTARMPALAEAGPQWAFWADNEHLVVSLASPTKRLAPLVRRITDPESGVLAPLERVLPYRTIDVQLAEAK